MYISLLLKLPESLFFDSQASARLTTPLTRFFTVVRDLIGSGGILGWKKDSSSQAPAVLKIENTISEITISVIQNSVTESVPVTGECKFTNITANATSFDPGAVHSSRLH